MTLLLWVLAAGFLSDAAAEEPRLRETVRKANEDRAAKIRTLRLEWSTRTRISELLVRRREEDDRRALPFLFVPADPQMAREELERRSEPIVWKAGFTESETETTLIVSGRRMRSETIGLAPQDTKRLTAKHRIASIDDMTAIMAEIRPAGVPWPQISIGPVRVDEPSPNGLAPRSLPSYLAIDRGPLRWLGPMGWIPLPQLLDPKREGIEEGTREVAGRPCVFLRQTHRNNLATEGVYDPAMGHTLIEETTTSAGELRTRLECRYRRDETLGAWLPTGWTETQFIDGEPHRIETVTVRQCAVNLDLADEAFAIAYPVGSIVSDERPDAEGFDAKQKAAIYLLRPDGVKRLIPFTDRGRRYDALLKEPR